MRWADGTGPCAAAQGPATCATAHVSEEGDQDWPNDDEAQRLHDGDPIALGALTARHTSGHTPERLAFLVSDESFARSPRACSEATSSSPATWAGRIWATRRIHARRA